MRKKKVYTHEELLKKFIIASLRRSSMYWYARNEALKAARIDRGLYKCAECGEAFSRKDIRMDHVDPVVKLSGFTNWDDYINRMFPKPEGFQALCTVHHDLKSSEERILRQIKKKMNK